MAEKKQEAKEAVKEAKPVKEGMVLHFVDPKRTNGGIRINGKLYVGRVQVTPEQSEDLFRIEREYSATIDKLTSPEVVLRNQSIETTRKAFMADPNLYGNHPRFSKRFGLTTAFQMENVSETDRLEWEEERMGLYNY